MAEQSTKQLLDDVKLFRKDSDFCDLEITCGDEVYRVHKIVVCTRSQFFAKAIKFPMGKEASDGRIDLPHDSPATIKRLIEYLYDADYEPRMTMPIQAIENPYNLSLQTEPHSCGVTGDGQKLCMIPTICPHHYCGRKSCRYTCKDFFCNQCGPLLPNTSSELFVHAKMYEIGDKYYVSGLKALARQKFQQAAHKHWDTPEFTEAAVYAFATTPEDDRGLREVVSCVIWNHMTLLIKPEIKSLMTEFGGLAFDLLKSKAHQCGWLK